MTSSPLLLFLSTVLCIILGLSYTSSPSSSLFAAYTTSTAPDMSVKNVLLIGANGKLGVPTLAALVAAGSFNVSVLKRAESTSVIPGADDGSVKVIDLPAADWTLGPLTKALKGQDAVVITFPLHPPDMHFVLAEAAAKAGVRRYIPADFGSADAQSEWARTLLPLFANKEKVRSKLQEMADASAAPGATTPPFTWTSIVGGHFFDWGLRGGFLHAFLDSRTQDVLNKGEVANSMSTLPQLARAIVAVLQRGTDDLATANRRLFVQSFAVTQNQVRAALEKAMGEPWTPTFYDADEWIAERKPKADAKDHQATEDLVFTLGTLDGDWTTRADYSMGLLQLKEENLDEVVKGVVADYKASK